MRVLMFTHAYDVSANLVWDVATDMACLQQVMGRKIVFRGLPTGPLHKGMRAEVQVSLFGLLPWQDYAMEITAFDPTERRFVSEERGAGVRTWRHTLTVEVANAGAVLQERLEIDAGWLTPLMALWARVVYRGRHRPRLRLFAERSAA